MTLRLYSPTDLPRYTVVALGIDWGVRDNETGRVERCADRGSAVERAGLLEGMERLVGTVRERRD